MLSEDDRLDIAADREISDDAHPSWGEQGDQLVEDHIAHRLVADLPIAILVHVEFQTFQLDDVLIWHIINDNGGKVRKARSRTETGELWSLQVDNVVSPRMGIGPWFQVVRFDFIFTVSAWRAL